MGYIYISLKYYNIMANKYKKIKLKDGATRDEHRLVMEKYVGRRLHFNECVHHINGDKSDNRLDNLEIMNRREHVKEHIDKGDMFDNKFIKKISRKQYPGDSFKCPCCEKVKHRSEFRNKKSTHFKITSYCRDCLKTNDRIYLQKKRENKLR